MISVDIEVDDTLGVGYSELSEGIILKLKHNIIIFITGGKIGIFDNSTIDSFSGDFSKISTSKIILQIEEEEGKIDEISNAIH